MPHPLSNDLPERVVAFVEAGNSCNQAARHFDTSVSFAMNLMMLYRETGAVQPRSKGGMRHGKLDAVEAFLLTSVKRSPDMMTPELAALLFAEKVIDVSPQSLSRWPINKGFSFKKTLRASEQDRPELAKARAEWKEGRQPIMCEQRRRLIFFDETSTNTKMTCLRGSSLKGDRLNRLNPFGRWGTQSFIAGLKCDGLVAPWIINAPMNRLIFDTYVETQLAPVLRPADVVILDNL